MHYCSIFSKFVIIVCVFYVCESKVDSITQKIRANWLEYNNFVHHKYNYNDFIQGYNEVNSFTEIPMADAFVTKNGVNAYIDKTGLHEWTSGETVISLFFYASEKTTFSVSIRSQVLSGGKSTLRLQLQNVTQDVTVSGKILSDFKVGQFSVEADGYYHIDLMGVTKDASYFAEVTHLIFEENHSISVIRRINGLRNSPSPYFWYTNVPKQSEYIYQELRVPKGFDPVRTYFCAHTFNTGYFGFQRNSETESRIVFAIWSPQVTNNPDEVTEDNEVKLLSKGKDVIDQSFGGEGSGQHAFLRYHWKTDTTYRLLVKAKPLVKNNNFTVYTAWWAEEQEDWNLLASFLRPKSKGEYISGWGSFSEDFGDSAYLPKVEYLGHQWAITPKGEWNEITKAKFSLPGGKALDEPRVQFDAGIKDIDGDEFFEMKFEGFEKGNITAGQTISRTSSGKKPVIIFSDLP